MVKVRVDFRLGAAVAAAAALLLAGCGNAAAPPASGSPSGSSGAAISLVESAKREGQVRFYGAFNPTTQERLASSFKSRYGVDVDAVRLASGPLAQRYAADAAAGNVVADVVELGDSSFFEDATKKGWLAGLADVDGARNWPQQFRADTFVKLALLPYGVTYNTDLVKAADAPASWQALLDPRWKGKLLLIDPRNTPAIMAWSYFMRETYGAGYLSQLAGQQFRLVASGIPGGEQVAAGSADIIAPSTRAEVLGPAKGGAPLAYGPIEPATGQEAQAGLSAKAPHPNAGRLFLSFLMSAEGQGILANDGYVPILPGVPGAPAVPRDYHSPQYAAAAGAQGELLGLLGLRS
jgi:ABC-type Fe3+ transport system substrate-binding protein